MKTLYLAGFRPKCNRKAQDRRRQQAPSSTCCCACGPTLRGERWRGPLGMFFGPRNGNPVSGELFQLEGGSASVSGPLCMRARVESRCWPPCPLPQTLKTNFSPKLPGIPANFSGSACTRPSPLTVSGPLGSHSRNCSCGFLGAFELSSPSRGECGGLQVFFRIALMGLLRFVLFVLWGLLEWNAHCFWLRRLKFWQLQKQEPQTLGRKPYDSIPASRPAPLPRSGCSRASCVYPSREASSTGPRGASSDVEGSIRAASLVFSWALGDVLRLVA